MQNVSDSIRWEVLLLLSSNEECLLKIDKLRSEYFYGDTGKIFEVIKQLFLDGKNFNWKIVCTIAGVDSPPIESDPKVFDQYVELLKESYNRYITKETLSTLDVYGSPITDIKSTLYNLLESLSITEESELSSTKNISKVVERISTPQEKALLRFGIEELDDLLYGLMPGEFFVLAARPSQGKSSCSQQLTLKNSYNNNNTTLFFSMEDSEELILKRFISNLTGISFTKIFRNDIDSSDKQMISGIVPGLQDAQIFIKDSTSDLFEIISTSRKAKIKFPNLNLIVVDYIQLINSGQDTEYREISIASKALKVLAKELKVAVVCVSQLSRSCEAREDKHPIPSDLRGSGCLEQDADRILFLYRPYKYDGIEEHKNIIEYNLSKNRHGETKTIIGQAFFHCFQFS